MLYHRYLDGEDDALRELLERHREGLFLFLLGMVGNREAAEDLMMDSFAALLAKDKPFFGRSSFKTWLFAIARHRAASFLRGKHDATVPMNENLMGDDGADLPLLQAEQSRVLFSSMARLKPEYRQALHLSYFEGMSAEEMAAVMKISRRKVSDLLYRGKQALKRELEQEGYADAQLG